MDSMVPKSDNSKTLENVAPASQALPWSGSVRGFVSLLLLVYLTILALGPLSNPSGSAHLTEPLARVVAPVHRALFLGHGYRFFAPEPGPGHSIECRMLTESGDSVEFRFPDRQLHQPRLLYHRWFMLAETLFTELNGTPDEQSFADAQKGFQQEIDALALAGKIMDRNRLIAQRDQLALEYSKTRERIDELIRAVASSLIQQHADAKSIQLYLRERAIPFPQDIIDGKSLSAPDFLSEPIPIGKFSRADLLRDSLEELP